jgi:hypothetical protein
VFPVSTVFLGSAMSSDADRCVDPSGRQLSAKSSHCGQPVKLRRSSKKSLRAFGDNRSIARQRRGLGELTSLVTLLTEQRPDSRFWKQAFPTDMAVQLSGKSTLDRDLIQGMQVLIGGIPPWNK